jgi:hypothetical protein
MKALTQSQRDCLDWLLKNGPDAVQVKLKTGGWYWLCRGETLPFAPMTINALASAGFVKISIEGGAKRLRAFAPSREPISSEKP